MFEIGLMCALYAAARAHTMRRVTVPTPAESSEMTPTFSGFVFIKAVFAR